MFSVPRTGPIRSSDSALVIREQLESLHSLGPVSVTLRRFARNDSSSNYTLIDASASSSAPGVGPASDNSTSVSAS